ncbi:trypsin-like serine protease [Myceligenerans pegani]|uniref:Trypsin-like serine protease n=1 Tax=Myceligenerans pegani TaxID=2776917 RepID=A0ABR9MS50_9MICO|nr:trypsin-like serine protease [Myceligenerans sp. TRM 65318]MBE1874200.1 trypsin-like serine protease [Myceligenerans sp. TRM 65318]MBE3016472.1 trypsin-like serine protease [Myceligenerans sp. TRM 65318]
MEPSWVRQVVRVVVGEEKACTGALVAPQWVLTAASCFTTDGSDEVRTGAAPANTTATIGRADLSTSDGYVRDVDRIVPHPDHDVALARLTLGVDVVPWNLTDSSVVDGESLALSGYGRTETVWAPDEVQVAGLVAGGISDSSFEVSAPAESTAAACDGDAGAPVTRSVDGAVEVVGVLVGSVENGCLEAPSDADRTGQVVRADVLAAWVERNAVWYKNAFLASYASADRDGDGHLDGIAGYDLARNDDQIVAVDYEGTGKLDHLLIYRPGPEKKYWVVKHREDGSYERVFHNSNAGIGPVPAQGTVLLGRAHDKVLAFDCHRTGKQDCIVVYRPGEVDSDSESASYSVFERDPDGGYQRIHRQKLGRLSLTADRMIMLDDEGSATGQHVVFYRPGAGWVTIVPWVLDDDAGGGHLGPNVYVNQGGGIAGFDVQNARDRMIAFDCHRSGRRDCLVAYRPGLVDSDIVSSSYRVIERTTGGGYEQVFEHRMGRLTSTADRVIAYDYDRSGKADHLVFYRPGAGWVTVVPWLRHADGSGEAGPAVYSNQGGGIAGYNMAHTRDRLIAYDDAHLGSTTGLVAYRPGSRLAWVLGRPSERGDAAVAVNRPAGDTSAVETFAYPGADGIFEERGIRLISGDGHVLLADCAEENVLSVSARGLDNQDVCFRMTGVEGYLKLNLPGAYLVHTNDYASTELETTAEGETTAYEFGPNEWGPIGESVDGREHVLVEIRVSR